MHLTEILNLCGNQKTTRDLKMSEKKVIVRNVAITLGIICVILAVGLVEAVANYTSIINNKDNTIKSKDSTIQSKDSEIQTLTNQKNQLQTWLDLNKSAIQTILADRSKLGVWLHGNLTLIYTLNWQISSLNYQIANLQSQINTLKAPKLKEVDLTADDNRPSLQTPYLHVYGYICNVGTNTAYNSKIHVVAYQSPNVVAIDTYITLGTIDGESWTNVDSNIYYNGSALTGWSLTLEWTQT